MAVFGLWEPCSNRFPTTIPPCHPNLPRYSPVTVHKNGTGLELACADLLANCHQENCILLLKSEEHPQRSPRTVFPYRTNGHYFHCVLRPDLLPICRDYMFTTTARRVLCAEFPYSGLGPSVLVGRFICISEFRGPEGVRAFVHSFVRLGEIASTLKVAP